MPKQDSTSLPCICFKDPAAPLTTVRSLGTDSHYGEASLLACPACGQNWLHYFCENEAFTRSGRWYRGPISPDQSTGVDAESARASLEGLEWYFHGGSYFDGKGGRSRGPILLDLAGPAMAAGRGPDLRKLIAVFEEVRSLVGNPHNDFSWSSWNDAPDALEEIDGILRRLRAGDLSPSGVSILFAPTGPLQELSLSSGWGDEFVILADRYDEAFADVS